MNLKRLASLLSILPLASLLTVNAQEKAKVEGYVTGGPGNDSIAGATVLLDANNVALTNTHGFFSLVADEGDRTITCRMTGYDVFKSKIRIAGGTSTRFDIRLTEGSNPLEEIVVSAEKYEQKLGE